MRHSAVPALLATMDALTLEQDFSVFFKKAASSVCKLLSADGAALILLDERKEFFEYVLFEGEHQDRLNTYQHMRFPSTNGIAGRVLRTKSSCFIRDYASDPDALPELIRDGLSANFVIPLISSDQVIGVLAASWFSTPVQMMSPQLFVLAERIASQIAVACHRNKLEEQLRAMACVDPLTQLFNRHGAMQFLEKQAERQQQYGRCYAVFFIDIDGLKTANDQWGHELGDQLLRDAANRLRDVVRRSDCIGRLGGDEFVVIAECSTDHVKVLARRFQQALRIHFGHGRKRGRLSASIGIAVAPLDSEDPQTLLRKADAAMYIAKLAGGDQFHFASDIRKTDDTATLSIIDIENAIDKGELALWAQPIKCLKSHRINGFEGLIRWAKPNGELIGALPIIKALEQARSNTEIRFGNYVLQKASELIGQWQELDIHTDLHINISARHFLHPSLLQTLQTIHLQQRSVCQSLVIEITESAMLDDLERAQRIMLRCKELGVRVAIDDFGTGYSSLSYLKFLPLDSIKIDRSFITDLPHNAVDRDIVKGIISIAHALKLTVVAEGAETLQHQQQLAEMHCDHLQGYLISTPMPAEAVISWYLHYHASANCA